MIEVKTWQTLKSFVDDRGLSIQEISEPLRYILIANDGGLVCIYYCMDRDPSDTTDLNDYETNYQPNANVTFSDGEAPLSRLKMAPKGWSYQARGVEFTTSLLNSEYSKKADGSDWGDITLKFYDSNDVELTTQPDIDANCVKTIMRWSPGYTYEIIGGTAMPISAITTNARVWCVGAPGMAGGDLEMISGINFKNRSASTELKVDGKTGKRMTYLGAPYEAANAIEKIVRHDAGAKHDFQIIFNYYRA